MLRRFFQSKASTENIISPAHSLLLVRLLKPRLISDFNEQWADVLQESPEKAIDRLEKIGLVTRANLSETLERVLTVDNLKNILRSKQLKVRGTKTILIQHLVETHPQLAQSLIQGKRVFICTDLGKAIATEMKTQAESNLAGVENSVLQALRSRQFKKACLLISDYERQQVFPRGLGFDWSSYNPNSDISTLEEIFKSHPPSIIGRVLPEDLENLRITAAMMCLWGVGKSKKAWGIVVKNETRLDSDTSARMILFAIRGRYSLKYYKQMHIKKIQVLVVVDSACDGCRQGFIGKVFSIGDAPELPHPRCTSPIGCRCSYNAVFD